MKTQIVQRKIFFLLLCVCIGFSNIQAQKGSVSNLPDRDKAINYGYCKLNGYKTTLDYNTAAKIFLQLSITGDAEASNALGMMLKHGLGTKQNDEKAFAYFSLAAEQGYAKAYYNLALMYKFGHYVEQDFTKATAYFEKASEMGCDGIDYQIGYASYKGIGKKQSYKDAVKYFEQGAHKGDASCMYFLGLCYFQGRGVERSVEQGKYWFAKAADLGANRAIDLMVRNKSENFEQKKVRLRSTTEEPINALVPLIYPQVTNTVNDNKIEGIWEGKIITYDWSGEEIEDETQLQVSLQAINGNIEGVWTESDTASVAISATMDNEEWRFDNIVLHASERPIEMRSGKFKREFKDGEEYLSGNVSFYCDVTREYIAPSYVVLKRVNNPSSVKNIQTTSLSVYPNPFNDRINVEFELAEAQNVRFAIYDMTGKRIYTSGLEEFGNGRQHYTIPTTEIPVGAYLLKLVGKSVNQSVKIVK